MSERTGASPAEIYRAYDERMKAAAGDPQRHDEQPPTPPRPQQALLTHYAGVNVLGNASTPLPLFERATPLFEDVDPHDIGSTSEAMADNSAPLTAQHAAPTGPPPPINPHHSATP